MKTMNLPGFSGEASLYVSRECYHAQMSMPGNGQVIPQLRISCLIKGGQSFLGCMSQGLFDAGVCASFARLKYSICDFLGG